MPTEDPKSLGVVSSHYRNLEEKKVIVGSWEHPILANIIRQLLLLPISEMLRALLHPILAAHTQSLTDISWTSRSKREQIIGCKV